VHNTLPHTCSNSLCGPPNTGKRKKNFVQVCKNIKWIMSGIDLLINCLIVNKLFCLICYLLEIKILLFIFIFLSAKLSSGFCPEGIMSGCQLKQRLKTFIKAGNQLQLCFVVILFCISICICFAYF